MTSRRRERIRTTHAQPIDEALDDDVLSGRGVGIRGIPRNEFERSDSGRLLNLRDDVGQYPFFGPKHLGHRRDASSANRAATGDLLQACECRDSLLDKAKQAFL